jgi:hypothetical protein
VPEARVVVEGDLGVERQHRAVRGLRQRVDLDQGGVLLLEDLPQLDGDRDAWSRTSAGNLAASTISPAVALSTPVVASTGMRASASGRSTASCSISMPPSTLAMARKVRLERSSR